MITFEIFSQLLRRKSRYLYTFGSLFFFSLVGKLLVNQAHSSSTWDFVFSILTNKFYCFILVPILFITLVSDLATCDLEDGYTSLVLLRNKNRFQWWMAKLAMLFLNAFFYTLIFFLFLIIASFVWGFSFNQPVQAPLLISVISYYQSMVFSFMIIALIYISTLTSTGLLVMTLSLFMKRTIIPWSLGTLMCVFTFGTYVDLPRVAKYLPITHLKLDLHAPFNPHPLYTDLTIGTSLAYLLCLFIVTLFLGVLRIRKMNFSK